MITSNIKSNGFLQKNLLVTPTMLNYTTKRFINNSALPRKSKRMLINFLTKEFHAQAKNKGRDYIKADTE
jgi:hypothetical protein